MYIKRVCDERGEERKNKPSQKGLPISISPLSLLLCSHESREREDWEGFQFEEEPVECFKMRMVNMIITTTSRHKMHFSECAFLE